VLVVVVLLFDSVSVGGFSGKVDGFGEAKESIQFYNIKAVFKNSANFCYKDFIAHFTAL
jgi:hypothetical protein